jgi:hypothetical protein
MMQPLSTDRLQTPYLHSAQVRGFWVEWSGAVSALVNTVKSSIQFCIRAG